MGSLALWDGWGAQSSLNIVCLVSHLWSQDTWQRSVLWTHAPGVFSQVLQRGSPSTLPLKSSESRPFRPARLLLYQSEGEFLSNRKKRLCGAGHRWNEVPAWHLSWIHLWLLLTYVEAAGGMAQHEMHERRGQGNRTSPGCHLPPVELFWGSHDQSLYSSVLDLGCTSESPGSFKNPNVQSTPETSKNLYEWDLGVNSFKAPRWLCYAVKDTNYCLER